MFPINLSRRRSSIHRKEQNLYLREMCGDLKPKTVLNIGAEPEAVDKEGGRYCDYFPNSEFKALDQRPHDHKDYLQGDLMDPVDHLGTFDLVLCMSVIEHIDRPWIAAPNISKLVAPGGHLFIAMPWFYPTHEGSDFGDHWRARPSGIKILFDDLTFIEEKYFSSPLVAISDRGRYWKNKDATAEGSAILFKKPT